MQHAFHSFIRLLPQAVAAPTTPSSPYYDGRTYDPLPEPLPHDLIRPYDTLPTLPVVPGDTLRFLVPRSFLGRDPRYLLPKLALYWRRLDPAGQPAAPVRVGKLREQDGAHYSEIRLRIQRAPAPGEYRQFALVYDDPVTGSETPVLGTFRWAATAAGGPGVSLDDFVEAVRLHYVNYPYTPVTVDVRGNELTIRAFHSDRFRLGHVALRVGLGLVKSQNTNQPSFFFQYSGTVDLPAQDVYRIEILPDIEAGNKFSLNGRTYLASGSESPSDILAALGVPGGQLVLSGNASPAPGMALGTYTSANGNRPSLEVLLHHSEGGSDYYQVIIGASLLPGNLFQISVEGLASRSRVVQASDTVASLTSYLTGGTTYLQVAQGRPVNVVALPGLRTFNNTNQAGMICAKIDSLPPRTIKRYVSSIGNSIQRGNRFTWESTTVTAPSDQTTPAQIAALFEQSGYPFILDIPVLQNAPVVYAEPGDAYNADEHLVDADVLTGSLWRPDGPLVAEVQLPKAGALSLPGRYQLILAKADSPDTVYARGNYFTLPDSARETMVLCFGPGDGPASTMGHQYDEPGLMQCVRVPVALSLSKLKQQESWASSLDGTRVRTSASAERSRTLTTTVQPEGFHLALYSALKHRQLILLDPRVNHKAARYRQEGEYTQANVGGTREYQQGQAELVEENTLLEMNTPSLAGGLVKGDASNSLALGLAEVDRLEKPGNMAVYLEHVSTGQVRQVTTGDLIQPGTYRLRARCEHKSLFVSVFVNNVINFETVLLSNVMNRTDEWVLAPASSYLSIIMQPLALLTNLTTPEAGTDGIPVITKTSPSVRPISSVYTNDYGPDFT